MTGDDETGPVDQGPPEVVTEDGEGAEFDPSPVPGVPDALFAAEAYLVDPSADRLRDLFDAIGGRDTVELATYAGASEIVTFDPDDPDRVLFSRRDGHETGFQSGENQDENMLLELADGSATVTPFAPDLSTIPPSSTGTAR